MFAPKTIRWGIKEEIIHTTKSPQIGSICPYIKDTYLAVSMKGIIHFSTNCIIDYYPTKLLSITYIEKFNIVVGISAETHEFISFHNNNLNDPVFVEGPSCDDISAFHIIYSQKSSVLITFGDKITTYDLIYVPVPKSIIYIPARVILNKLGRINISTPTSLLNPPMFNPKREVIYVNRTDEKCVVAYSLNGKMIDKIVPFQEGSKVVCDYCASNPSFISASIDFGVLYLNSIGKVLNQYFVSLITPYALRFFDEEHVIMLEANGKINVLNVETGNMITVYETKEIVTRIYIYNGLIILVVKADIIILRPHFNWRRWATTNSQPAVIQRVCKRGSEDKILILCNQSYIRIASPKGELLSSLTLISTTSPITVYYDRTVQYGIDRDLLFIPDDNGTLYFYSPQKCPCEKLKVMEIRATGVALCNMDGNPFYAFSCINGNVLIYDYFTMKQKSRIYVSALELHGIFFSEQNHCLLIVFENKVQKYDMIKEKLMETVKIHRSDVNIFFNNTLIFGYDNGEFGIVKFKTDGKLEIPNSSGDRYHDAKVTGFSAGYEYFISSSLDCSLKIWNTDFQAIYRLIFPFPLYACSVLNGKRQILVGTEKEVMVVDSPFDEEDPYEHPFNNMELKPDPLLNIFMNKEVEDDGGGLLNSVIKQSEADRKNLEEERKRIEEMKQKMKEEDIKMKEEMEKKRREKEKEKEMNDAEINRILEEMANMTETKVRKESSADNYKKKKKKKTEEDEYYYYEEEEEDFESEVEEPEPKQEEVIQEHVEEEEEESSDSIDLSEFFADSNAFEPLPIKIVKSKYTPTDYNLPKKIKEEIEETPSKSKKGNSSVKRKHKKTPTKKEEIHEKRKSTKKESPEKRRKKNESPEKIKTKKESPEKIKTKKESPEKIKTKKGSPEKIKTKKEESPEKKKTKSVNKHKSTSNHTKVKAELSKPKQKRIVQKDKNKAEENEENSQIVNEEIEEFEEDIENEESIYEEEEENEQKSRHSSRISEVSNEEEEDEQKSRHSSRISEVSNTEEENEEEEEYYTEEDENGNEEVGEEEEAKEEEEEEEEQVREGILIKEPSLETSHRRAPRKSEVKEKENSSIEEEEDLSEPHIKRKKRKSPQNRRGKKEKILIEEQWIPAEENEENNAAGSRNLKSSRRRENLHRDEENFVGRRIGLKSSRRNEEDNKHGGFPSLSSSNSGRKLNSARRSFHGNTNVQKHSSRSYNPRSQIFRKNDIGTGPRFMNDDGGSQNILNKAQRIKRFPSPNLRKPFQCRFPIYPLRRRIGRAKTPNTKANAYMLPHGVVFDVKQIRKLVAEGKTQYLPILEALHFGPINIPPQNTIQSPDLISNHDLPHPKSSRSSKRESSPQLTTRVKKRMPWLERDEELTYYSELPDRFGSFMPFFAPPKKPPLIIELKQPPVRKSIKRRRTGSSRRSQKSMNQRNYASHQYENKIKHGIVTIQESTVTQVLPPLCLDLTQKLPRMSSPGFKEVAQTTRNNTPYEREGCVLSSHKISIDFVGRKPIRGFPFRKYRPPLVDRRKKYIQLR